MTNFKVKGMRLVTKTGGLFSLPSLINIAFTAIIGYIVLRAFKSVNHLTGFLPGLDDNPLKAQSIETAEKRIEATEVYLEGLKNSSSFYATIADRCEQTMQGAGTDSKTLFSLLEPLNAEELKAVYKSFGIRKNSWMILGSYTGDLFTWFDQELTDIWEGNNLTRMKQIWTKTNLW